MIEEGIGELEDIDFRILMEMKVWLRKREQVKSSAYRTCSKGSHFLDGCSQNIWIPLPLLFLLAFALDMFACVSVHVASIVQDGGIRFTLSESHTNAVCCVIPCLDFRYFAPMIPSLIDMNRAIYAQ